MNVKVRGSGSFYRAVTGNIEKRIKYGEECLILVTFDVQQKRLLLEYHQDL